MSTTGTVEAPEWSVARLFHEFADSIYTLGFRILGDRHLAEDVVQQTFIKVITSLSSYRGDGPIGGWLYRIGYREAITISRKRREAVTDPHDVSITSIPARDSVEDDAIAGELIRVLDAALAELSEPLRATFALRDIEGLSVKEVSSVLEISESAVKMRLSRAREALRVQLKEYVR